MDIGAFECSPTNQRKHKIAYSKVFQIIDEEIVDCKFNFSKLRCVYLNWFNYLKGKAGTSAGFTGLAEYIILQTIFLYLEQNLKISFGTQAKTENVNFFVSKDKRILITHGISINKEMGKVVNEKFGKNIIWSFSNKSPDIVIFKSTINGYSPEAIIQIKIYAVSPKIIDDEINKIEEILSSIKSNKPLCSMIFFYPTSEETVNKLKRDFNFVITPENPDFIGMLREIEMRLR